MSCLTLTQPREAGTMIIPTPRARKLRDMHEGFPRSHSQPVASDPASALIVTMLCCYRWASLGPSPLSDPHPVTSQIPVGTLFWGHWDTLFDCKLLELLSEPWVVGTSTWIPPAQGKVFTPAWPIQAGGLNQEHRGSGRVSQNLVFSGHKHGFS